MILFNEQEFLQTSGTVMGNKYVPSIANIFMVNLEDEVLLKAKCKPLVIFRFIDDIFSPGTIKRWVDGVQRSI